MANVLITGANRGIGLALTRAFSKRSYEVQALYRKPSADLLKLPNLRIVESIDITDLQTVKNFVASLSRYQHRYRRNATT